LERDILEVATKLFSKTLIARVYNQSLLEVPEENLSQVQLLCLRYVYTHSEPSVGSIAEGLNISAAAAAKLIDRLVKRNLLIREEDQADRRVLKIKLTQRGEQILSRINEYETKYFQAIIAKMAKEDAQSLQAGLIAFLKAALITPEQIDEVCLKCGWEHFLDCPGNQLYHLLTGKNKEEY
jgi:DNA-binding MarR family transcriptional regulator